MSDRERLSGEHAWVEERLSTYIDDQLGAAERARLESHLDGCARCRGSLESLRWTVSLVRQAPAPQAPRSFVLPIPASAGRVVRPRADHARAGLCVCTSLATALVAFLLVAVVGLDAISHLGGGLVATAPVAAPAAPGAASAAASESAKPTTIARAPEIAPSQGLPPTLTSAPEPSLAPAGAVPAPTFAPRLGVAPIAPPAPQGAPPTGLGGGPPETTAPDNAVQSAAQPAVTPATVPERGLASASPTAPAPAPRVTAVEPHKVQTAAPPTAASKAQAIIAATPTPPAPAVLVQTPTVGASEASRENNGEPGIPPLRVVEIGLFVFAVVLGSASVLLWRNR